MSDARRTSPSRTLALALATAVLSGSLTLVAGSAAAEDEPAPPTPDSVVGELVQAWPEYKDHGVAAGRADDGPLSWVETDTGETVRVTTEDVDHIPVGSTVEVAFGEEVQDAAAVERGLEPAREVLEVTVLESAPATTPPAAASTTTNDARRTAVLSSSQKGRSSPLDAMIDS